MYGNGELTLSARLVGLIDGLDDADGNRLPHVTDGETTKRGVLVVRLHAHGLAGHELGNASIARLDELRRRFQRFTCPAINLLDELRELAGNVGGVAVEDGSVTSTDLTRVVQDDDLGSEVLAAERRVVLGVTSDVATADILDGNVLHVEADVVAGDTLGQLLVVHLDGLDFSGDVGRGECDNHAGLQDTSLDTADGNSSNTTNLVDILERETEGLVGGTDGRLDGVDGVEEGLALDDTSLGLLGPTLVPRHAEQGAYIE